MSIFIGRFEFDGPYPRVDDLENKAGVFAILYRLQTDDYELLELNQASNIKESLRCFSDTESIGPVFLAVYYSRSKEERSEIIDEIWKEFNVVTDTAALDEMSQAESRTVFMPAGK